MILLAVIFPIVIGLVAYGVAWVTGLAQFDPPPSFASELTSSPVGVFVIMLILITFIDVFPASFFAAGEEIGWRGYMLTRLIDAGVPRPILASGLIWGLWHIPLILGGCTWRVRILTSRRCSSWFRSHHWASCSHVCG